jgi:hypothetical protein
MGSTHLRQSLIVSATLGLALLIVALIGFGVAIRLGAVVPPTLEVRIYQTQILAYRTDYPECPPTTLCPSESIATPPTDYVVWSIYEPPMAHQPYGRTAKRVMAVPLQR